MSLIAAALLTLTASQAAPAPAPAPAPTVAAKFTLDTPIETLQADPAARAAVAAGLGSDVGQHPMYESFKTMSLNQVAPMSGGAVTPEMLAKVAAGLAAIK